MTEKEHEQQQKSGGDGEPVKMVRFCYCDQNSKAYKNMVDRIGRMCGYG